MSSVANKRTAFHLAKKVLFDSLGLVVFVVGLVDSFLYLPDRQVKFLKKFFSGKSNSRTTVRDEIFFGLARMTCGLVHLNYSLPKGQA